MELSKRESRNKKKMNIGYLNNLLMKILGDLIFFTAENRRELRREPQRIGQRKSYIKKE